MPVCKYCNTDRSADRFSKGRKKCKDCQNQYVRAWVQENKEERYAKLRVWRKAYYQKNRQYLLACTKTWRDNNKHRLGSQGSVPSVNAKRWREANPDKVREATKRNWELKKNATPVWANRFFLREARELAKLRTKLFGFEWQVDHIIPFNNPNVCGLNWEGNIQVIPAIENIRKGNKYDADSNRER